MLNSSYEILTARHVSDIFEVVARSKMRAAILGCTSGVGVDLRTICLMLDDDILADMGAGATGLTLTGMRCTDTVFLTHSHLDHAGSLPRMADL